MLKENDKVFNNLYGQHGVSLDVALNKLGDFANLADILIKGRQFIVSELKDSNLKGRGGAGFPTGMKWSFMNPDDGRDHYLVINGDEGEPGTCKDRELLRHEPYKILEGIIIGAYTINAKKCYVYIRGEFYDEIRVLQQAIDELYQYGYLGKNCFELYDLDVIIHEGSGAYICGEETALLESLEGKKAFPRVKPPFPANFGLYGCPTLINNVETIAVVPTILRKGSEWYNSLGVTNGIGTKLFCISGAVNNPCVVEEEIGVDFNVLINQHAGGVIGGDKNFKAIIPGGTSTPILPASVCNNLKMDFDSLKQVGSALGTGAVIVIPPEANIVKLLHNVVHFYHNESCGQCTPCREGSGVALKILEKICDHSYEPHDIEILDRLVAETGGTSICGLHDATVFALRGFLKHYKHELLNYGNI